MNSPKPRAELREQRAGRDRADDGIGEPPAELLGDLERERLRALGVVRAQADVHERPGQLERELDGQPAAVVVAPAHLVDRRPVRGRGEQLLALEPGGAEHRRFEPFDGGPRRDRACEVPGRGARERPEPELLRLRARDRDDAVLEGVRRVRGVQLEIELAQAERLGEPGCLDERGQAGREPRLDGRLDRQERAVAPERRRAGGDASRASGAGGARRGRRQARAGPSTSRRRRLRRGRARGRSCGSVG